MNSVVSVTPAQRRELFNAAAQKMGCNAAPAEKDCWMYV
jgi:hypothetical protein